MADVTIDPAAFEWLTNSPDGPVGQFLEEKAVQMAALAKSLAPLQKPQNYSWGRHSTSYLPRSSGYTKASVSPHLGFTKGGQLFGGANVAFGPTLFLQKPAKQMHRAIPFMTEALYAITID